MLELEVRRARAVEHRHLDRGEDLALAHRRGEQVDEELARLDRALPLLRLQVQRRVERLDHRRQVGAGVGVGEVAADGAAVAHLRIADLGRRLGHDRARLLEHVGRGELGVGGERADAHARSRALDAGELLDAADVDQVGGLRQPQLHHRQQAVAAGEELGVLLRAQEVERLSDARGAVIVELGRVHLKPS